MHFIQIKGFLLNVGEIESIVDKPGNTAILTFRGGRTLDIPDATAGLILALLEDNSLVLKRK